MVAATPLTLFSASITTALTASVASGEFSLRGGHLNALALQANFTYGSGGTNLKAWVQTSFDAGATWVDIANFAATTTSLRRLYNLTSVAVTSIATPTDGTLADNTAVNGLLGPIFRVKITTTGTYAATTLVISAVAK